MEHKFWHKNEKEIHQVYGMDFTTGDIMYFKKEDKKLVMTWVESKNAQLLQSSGLKSKEGGEIVDGDIIKLVDGSIRFVKLLLGCFYSVADEAKECLSELNNSTNENLPVEIIDNVFSSKEYKTLLKQWKNETLSSKN